MEHDELEVGAGVVGEFNQDLNGMQIMGIVFVFVFRF